MKAEQASGPSSHRDAVEEAAVDWLIRRDAGFGPREADAFQAWLKANPHHAAAFAEAEAVLGRLSRPRELGRNVWMSRELAARQDRRRAWWRRAGAATAAGLAAAAAVVLALLPSEQPPAVGPRPVVATVAIRPDHQTLDDGSVVQLNADAEIRPEYSAGRRGVRLIRGEALFSVAKDAARPFVVMVAGVEVRAIGTEFSVRRALNAVDVLVTEGRVAVEHPAAAADHPRGSVGRSVPIDSVAVGAGARVSIPLDASSSAPVAAALVSPAEVEAALAWRSNRVEFSGTPLGEAVALFNRHNRLQLTFGEPALAELYVSGIFWKDNPESFARLLEISFDVSADRAASDRIVLRRTPGSNR